MSTLFVVSFMPGSFDLEESNSPPAQKIAIASTFGAAMQFIEENYVLKKSHGFQFDGIRWNDGYKLVQCLVKGDTNWEEALHFFAIEEVQFFR